MGQNPVLPKALQPGDKIGVIPFSGPSEASSFQSALEYLAKLGRSAVVEPDPSAYYGKTEHMFSAASASARLTALENFLNDSDLGCILAARGAYGALELLSGLTASSFRKGVPAIIGCSDSTFLLVAVNKLTSLVTFHGPTALSGFSRAETDKDAKQSVDALLELLSGQTLKPFGDRELSTLYNSSEPESAGRLIGGNLSALSALMGTPWEPDFSDSILFFEEVGEKPYRVHRMLLQMKLAGKFKSLRAVLIGSLKGCEHPKGAGPNVEQVLKDIFPKGQLPVFTAAPFGHESLNLTLPIGIQAKVAANKLELLEAPVLK